MQSYIALETCTELKASYGFNDFRQVVGGLFRYGIGRFVWHLKHFLYLRQNICEDLIVPLLVSLFLQIPFELLRALAFK